MDSCLQSRLSGPRRLREYSLFVIHRRVTEIEKPKLA